LPFSSRLNDCASARAAKKSVELATAVSHDVRTMPRYFQEFVRRQSRPGLILAPQKLALSAAIDELVLLWIASEDYEWVNRICSLPI